MYKKTIKIKKRRRKYDDTHIIPSLTIYQGRGTGRQFALDTDSKTIGRESEADIFLDDEQVSRKHAVIEKSEEGYRILDLKSLNGTIVNHKYATSTLLRDGDWIQIGDTLLRFQYVDTITSRFLEKAARDPLTDLWNKERFQQDLNRELQRLDVGGLPLSLMMIDIDFFKKVNDNHGHRCGDQVLKHVAELIASTLGNRNFTYRYGGEEFAAIIPEKGTEEAGRRAEDMRKAVEQEKFIFEGKELSLTISIGVLSLSGSGVSPEIKDLIDQVDQAMYDSKKNGRNRVSSRTISRAVPQSSPAT